MTTPSLRVIRVILSSLRFTLTYLVDIINESRRRHVTCWLQSAVLTVLLLRLHASQFKAFRFQVFCVTAFMSAALCDTCRRLGGLLPSGGSGPCPTCAFALISPLFMSMTQFPNLNSRLCSFLSPARPVRLCHAHDAAFTPAVLLFDFDAPRHGVYSYSCFLTSTCSGTAFTHTFQLCRSLFVDK